MKHPTALPGFLGLPRPLLAIGRSRSSISMSSLFLSMGRFFPLAVVAGAIVLRAESWELSLVSRRVGAIAFAGESQFLGLPGLLLVTAGISKVATSSDAEESVAYSEEVGTGREVQPEIVVDADAAVGISTVSTSSEGWSTTEQEGAQAEIVVDAAVGISKVASSSVKSKYPNKGNNCVSVNGLTPLGV